MSHRFSCSQSGLLLNLSSPVSRPGKGSASSLSLCWLNIYQFFKVLWKEGPSRLPALSHYASRWHFYSVYVNDLAAHHREKRQKLCFIQRVSNLRRPWISILIFRFGSHHQGGSINVVFIPKLDLPLPVRSSVLPLRALVPVPFYVSSQSWHHSPASVSMTTET